MSVRRRAVRERISRDKERIRELEAFTRPMKAIQEMCERKIATGESTITAEEIGQCFQVKSTEGEA